jgi:NitT/TauT family transport system substrate-binding protein
MNNILKFAIASAIILAVIITSIPVTSLLNGGKSVSAINNSSLSSGESNGSSTLLVNASQSTEKKIIRIGYFANINHAQPVIGLANGDYQKVLGNDVELRSQVFSAGPSAIEALFANQIDLAYVGPNPTINGFVQSGGQALKVVSGTASGGVVFVVRNDSGIKSIADFTGKRFASPQLGNTQDVALRNYLLANGYRTKENGGSVEVLPAATPDIFTLMIKKDIDGAWVPEPWGAKLVHEANAHIFLDERQLWPQGEFVTTNLVARTDFLQKNPYLVQKIIEATVNETIWINQHPDDAYKVFNIQLQRLTGKTLPETELKDGFSRLKLTWDPVKTSLYKSASDAYQVGFLKQKPNLDGIYDLSLLNGVLKQKGLPAIA